MELGIQRGNFENGGLSSYSEESNHSKVEILMFGGKFLVNNPQLVYYYTNGLPINVSQEVIRTHIKKGELVILDSSTMSPETKYFLGIEEN